MKDLHARYGEFALVTGASAGMGAEFARQLAEAGFSLVLVARRVERLEKLAESLHTRHGTRTEIVALDLRRDGAVADLDARTANLDVGFVVATAGVLTSGAFVRNPLSEELDEVRLNLLVPAELAHTFGGRFVRRRRGALILVGSTVGQQATPYLANYAATKAYIASLGQALHYELKPEGVDVMVLTPGPTRTEGVETAEGIDFAKLPVPMMSPERVVEKALRSIGKRSFVIPGRINRFMDVIGKSFTPRSIQTRMFGVLLKRALDEDPNRRAA